MITTLIIQRYIFWAQHKLEESVRSNSLSNPSAITLYPCSGSLPQGKLQCPLVSRFIALSYEQIDFPSFKLTHLYLIPLCVPLCATEQTAVYLKMSSSMQITNNYI